MLPEQARRSACLSLSFLALAAGVSCLAFMLVGMRGNWSFVLAFRGMKLAMLCLVAYAVAVSTVMFQTITNNRILTPSVMGFDALYVLLQTTIVFAWGARGLSGLDPRLMFLVNVGVMVAFSVALHRILFSTARRDLHLLLLVGIVLGILFRSLTEFLQRLINPNDFVVLQDRMFASFNVVDGALLSISAVLVFLVSFGLWRLAHCFDVLTLGRDSAISLGVNHSRVVTLILMMVCVLVAVCTALVGPITFFGLLVANLAYMLMPTGRHRHILPAAVLIAIICLVGGQMVLERLLAFKTALSIVIEFCGGIVFILLLLKGRIR